jgi:hypothetical protein
LGEGEGEEEDIDNEPYINSTRVNYIELSPNGNKIKKDALIQKGTFSSDDLFSDLYIKVEYQLRDNIEPFGFYYKNLDVSL